MSSARFSSDLLTKLSGDQLAETTMVTRAIKRSLEARPVRTMAEDEMLSIARANLRKLSAESKRRCAEAQLPLFKD